MVRQQIEKVLRKASESTSGLDNRMPYILTAILAFAIVVFAINCFIELSADVKNELMRDFDASVTSEILSLRNPILTDYFTFVTNIGDVKGYLIVLILASLLTWAVIKKWRYVLQTFVILILATLSNIALKRFFDRARPEIEHLVIVKTLSYPSGHAMSAMAFYGFIIYLVYKLRAHFLVKFALILSLSILILSIGISRIYLGVHYPSDVLGGFIAGIIWVFFCIFILNLFEAFKRDPNT